MTLLWALKLTIDPDVVNVDDAPFVPPVSIRSVAVFVLDVRTNKTPWKQGSAAYPLDWEGDYLGERQWQWFEEAIRRSRASINVIVNGLQVHGNRFPNGNFNEAWTKYPRAQQRLFDALLQDGVDAPILISGDVHMTQLSRRDCVRKGAYNDQPRSLMEMTTSGMTHSWGTLSNPPRSNPQRQAGWRERFESFVARTTMTALHKLCPWNDLTVAAKHDVANGRLENGGAERAKQGLQYSLAKNFGELEFDWTERTVTLRSLGEDSTSPPLLAAKVSFDQLSGRESMHGGRLGPRDFEGLDQLRNSSLPDSEWTCINHRGGDNVFLEMIGHLSTGVVLAMVLPSPILLPIVALWFLARRLTKRPATKKAAADSARSTCKVAL